MNRSPAHHGGKDKTRRNPVFWIKIKKFDERGLKRGHEEFTHPDWAISLDKLRNRIDEMAGDGSRSFEISITPSKE